MTMNEVFKETKKKKPRNKYNKGIDWESGLNVDTQRFMEEVKKKKKKARNILDGRIPSGKKGDSGVDFNHSDVDTYFDLRDANYF